MVTKEIKYNSKKEQFVMSDKLLKPYFWSIGELFKYRFSVPVYQRPYSWKTAEVNNLLNDIIQSYNEYKTLTDDAKQKASLYVGNIILHRKSLNVYDIIDGQQRITTFSLLLLAIYARILELNGDINNRILIKIQSALWKLDINDAPEIDKRVIELGSIEKEIMVNIFNEAFSNPRNLKNFIKNYSVKSMFEDNVKQNFITIYNYLNVKFNDSINMINDILQFANYILGKVCLIAIINEDSEFKTFSIFESINSKGKRLEDIDLIKTKIFSCLNPNDYSSYLTKWGKLITDTQDNLYNYFKIYIKANIKYYTGNVTFHHFEGMERELCRYFCKSNIGDAYKAMIDDMVNKMDFFNAVFNLDKAISIIKNKRFKFYYSIYSKINYEHPWPLFFRCFCEYNNGKGTLSEADLIDIIIQTIKFCITFLTVCGKDSKDEISMFSQIFDNIYKSKKINKDWVNYQIRNKIISSGIRKEELISALKSADVYDKNKQLGAAILSTYESQYQNNNSNQISWDEAYSKFSTYGSSYTLDHIMVQTPVINDPNLKYYKLGNNLKLKDGHDFPIELVHDGMEYDEFKSRILHRPGNLRLLGGDGNASHGNVSDANFSTYSKLEERNNLICTFFVNNVINIDLDDKIDNKPISLNTKNKKLSGNYDFSMSYLDLTGTKPKSITICGNTTLVNSNIDILRTIIKYLFSINQNKLIELAKQEWKPKQKIILSTNPRNLTKAYEVLHDVVYMEENFSANAIFEYAVLLLKEFMVDRKSVSIFIPE